MSGPPASGVVAAELALSPLERRARVLARVKEKRPDLSDLWDLVQKEEEAMRTILFQAGVPLVGRDEYFNWRVDVSLWMKHDGRIEDFPETQIIIDYPTKISTAENAPRSPPDTTSAGRHNRQQVWGLICNGLEPFPGCQPFEIPLTKEQKATYAANVVVIFSSARFFSVELHIFPSQNKAAHHQWVLRVWFTKTADPGQYKDLNQLQEAWFLLCSWYKAILQGRGVDLYRYITEYRQSQMEDRRKLMLGGSGIAIEHNKDTDMVPATGPASYTDATTATEEPDEEPRASPGELGVIKEEVARICAGLAFNDTMPELRKFALRNPRALRLSPQAILYHAVKAWRDGCTERIDAILQGMIL